ncbi:glycogen debranching protein GlgX [Ancylobacter sp. WKF20]|uniref:glycogen debranching protein GlgX n=1 Tax=Ancylobacter sp. WKF20 TaxID=3039801 RepID=UPI0024344E1E|nr:glycogen debranching protein GlgX [Ancylobacter sp. WKF20]WGD32063.1 glycogen debranching protein GlgX [Ancylobacter sp. WKF20]
MSAGRVSTGRAEPLGVTLDAAGVNVAVFSAHAESIEFCLFDADDREIARIPLPGRTGDVFHGYIAGVREGARYGLRAAGPWAPERGHRFNPAKLLVDPYAVRLDRPFALHATQFDARVQGAARDDTDSAPFVPKAIVTADLTVAPAAPAFGWDGQVIYELHVRGFTQLNEAVPVGLRGTFAGLAEPAALDHLVKLGITTVELMPSMAWVDERHLPPLGLSNYWGYNPVVFGAPDPRLAPGGFAEVTQAIAALHGAGIKVVLDVVLNHSGESDAFGPTLSLRGLDNATYHRHAADDPARLINDAGTGNTLALERAPVLRLAMDALRRWAATGLDGFRFDLAATLGRRADGFDPHAPFLAAMQQDPVLRDLALIAEPWDIGPGGYQVGQFPPGWGEWNDRFRDDVRRFWRGEAGTIGDLATRLAGSADLFAARRRPLTRGINFVTAHDGFTLADLVAYERKHNEANGEDNRDGTNDNRSWNHGIEGPTDDPGVIAARKRDVRGLLATLLMARGTPMLTMGDEAGRSQGGNNNAYAQDNALTWLDWSGLDTDLAAFTARLIELRRFHRALQLDAPLTGRPLDASGVADVEWRAPEGGAPSWGDREARALVVVFYAPALGEAPADRVAVAFNAGWTARPLALPVPRDGHVWQVAADTADTTRVGDDVPAELAARAVLIIVEVPAPEAPRRAPDPALLERLAAAAGIANEWWDVEGTQHIVPDDTKRALLAGLRLPAGSIGEVADSLAALSEQRFGRDVPFAHVLQIGAAAEITLAGAAARATGRLDAVIELESGEAVDFPIRPDEGRRAEVERPDGRLARTLTVPLPELPIGRHVVRVGDSTCALTIAPPACYLPMALADGERWFGIGTHLYTLRRASADQGIGDFTALTELGTRAAGEGARVLGLNPLHALLPNERERASPYSPSDRRFLDPIYIDVAALGVPMDDFPALAAKPSVDYTGVWKAKEAALRRAFGGFRGDEDFTRFVADGGAMLERFATFQAIAGVYPDRSWRDWPDGLADATGPAVAAFARDHAEAVRFALWQQWVADRQLGAAAVRVKDAGLSLGFYRDLAVGTSFDGAEAWSEAGMLMPGVTIGAPPDPLGPEGQNWNLPPFDPLAWQRDGYASFARLVAANMRHAGALRIDHVMGLRRLFLIPQGASGTEGTYLAMPFEDLAAQVALESHRARCLVVGEDLGTVPGGMREHLAEQRMLSYRVLWFERQDEVFIAPEDYPPLAAACVSTHDLPTLPGWWDGVDFDERLTLGLDDAAAVAKAREARAAEKVELAAALVREGLIEALPAEGEPLSDAFFVALHAYVARTRSMLALAQIDDLGGERVAVNLPGTDSERPNWRRRLAMPVETVLDTPRAKAALAAMRTERGRAS